MWLWILRYLFGRSSGSDAGDAAEDDGLNEDEDEDEDDADAHF